MSTVNSQNPMSSAAAKSAPKKVVKKEAAPAAPAPVAAPAAPAAPAAKKAKAAAPAAAPAPVAAPAVTAQPVAAEATPVEETSWQVELEAVQKQLAAIRDAAATALAATKRLEKRAAREIKDARKNRRRARAAATEGGEKKPSIFQIPVPISNELAAFLNVPRQGSAHAQLSRSEVTKKVMAYVTENKLNNKHDINPNAALKKLLSVADGDKLSIFNMQSYLQRHYIKPAPAASA